MNEQKVSAPRSPLEENLDATKLDSMDRLVSLSDGIYAFAMTLLAINVDIPRLATTATQTEVTSAILNLYPEVIIFVTSFLLVAMYWQVFRRLTRYLARSDGLVSWYMLLQLMFVAFLPVATGLFDTYGDVTIVILVYAGTLAGIGILGQLMWTHANKAGLIAQEMNPLMVEYYTFRGYFTIGLYFAVGIVGVIAPGYARYVLIALLLCYPLLQRIFKFQYRIRHRGLA